MMLSVLLNNPIAPRLLMYECEVYLSLLLDL